MIACKNLWKMSFSYLGITILLTTISRTAHALRVFDEIPLEDSSLTTTTMSDNPESTTGLLIDSRPVKEVLEIDPRFENKKPSLIRVPLIPVRQVIQPQSDHQSQSQEIKSLLTKQDSSKDSLNRELLNPSSPKQKFNSKDSPETIPVVLKSPPPTSFLQSSSVVPYTVTNEVMSRTTSEEDLDFLCHHYYKDDFVVSAQVQEQGCRLECVLLKSSGVHGNGFFDTSVTKIHTINEGQSCDKDVEAYKCVNGSCIEPPETGKAVISILNATVFKQDEDSDSDPYVKVYLDQKYLMKTRVIENSNNPIWMTSFVTPVMTSDAQLGFIVFDKDPGGEELLLTVQTSVSMILALGQNATAVCGPQGSPKGQLCYLIKWYPLNLDI